MTPMWQTLWEFHLIFSLLIAAVVVTRFLLRHSTQVYNAYLLWLAIPLGLASTALAQFGQWQQSGTLVLPLDSYAELPQHAMAMLSDDQSPNGVYWVGLVAMLLLLRLIWQHLRLRADLARLSAPLPQILDSRYPVKGIDKPDFSPAVYGFVFPRIYFPIHLFDELPAEQIRLIVRHEEHHIQQRHPWLNLAWDVLVCCFWFNPLFYLARQQFRHDQELYCDYLVLNQGSDDIQKPYGMALLSTVAATHSVSLLCSWKAFNQLEERIMNLNKPTTLQAKLMIAISTLLLTFSASLVSVNAGEKADSKEVHKEIQIKKSRGDGITDEHREINENGITWRQKNDEYTIEEDGKKRAMTDQERAEFEARVKKYEQEYDIEHLKKEGMSEEIDIDSEGEEKIVIKKKYLKKKDKDD